MHKTYKAGQVPLAQLPLAQSAGAFRVASLLELLSSLKLLGSLVLQLVVLGPQPVHRIL